MIKDFSHKQNELQGFDASHGCYESQLRDASHTGSELQGFHVSHFGFESHFLSASHSHLETHMQNASQIGCETQGSDASHSPAESHVESASHSLVEPFGIDASHLFPESQQSDASHRGVVHHRMHAGQLSPAFQRENASHANLETHDTDASHPGCASQKNDASQYNDENQPVFASQLSLETHLSNASQGRNEHPVRNASHPWSELQDAIATLLLNGKYSEFVKKYVITKRIELKEIENLIWFHNKLYETEKELYRILDSWSKEHPLRVNFLNKVRGIGPVLASGIIAWLSEPILKAEHVSNLWSYCGLAPGSERRRGEKLNYNPKLKTFCWKIGQSFIKFRCFGRKLYEKFKEDVKNKHPDWSKLHIHNYARRKVVKLFLASVWEVWRRMNNLPVTEPYPIKVLGHAKIIPEMWMERG